jgi:iron complex transport system substrate-binding protein
MTETIRRRAAVCAAAALAFALWAGPLAAQGGQEPTPTRTVKDSRGETVAIPAVVERVAPLIGAFAQITEMLTLGGGKMVAFPVGNISREFREVFPDVNESNPRNLDSGSVEDILASGAQVVYGPQSRLSSDGVEFLRSRGVSVVILDSLGSSDGLAESFATIGEILGEEEAARAGEFIDYYRKGLADAASRTASVPPERRVRALVLSRVGGSYGTVNENDICNEYLQAAGAVNVAADYPGSGPNPAPRVDPEFVLGWDPDLIFTYSQTQKEDILKDPALATLKAVAGGRVVVFPAGIYLWSVRSGEGAMMAPWLGTVLYPELFADVDMAATVQDFYLRFYGRTIDRAEAERVLKGM